VAIEYHFVEGDYVRLPELVADLVRRKVARSGEIAHASFPRSAKRPSGTEMVETAIQRKPQKVWRATSTLNNS
jgi:hypothetical protein